MAKNIIISNGTSTSNIANGNYNVTATVAGYDNLSINPATLNVVEGTNDYAFTISATGVLKLRVTEDGLATGTPVAGAVFSRTDSTGTPYGDSITTDSNGEATFNNIPFAAENAPTVYYKQISTNDNNEFDATLKNTTLTEQEKQIEIANPLAAERIITLTDENYSGLPIENAEISLQQ